MSGRTAVRTRFSPRGATPRPAHLREIADAIPHSAWLADSDGEVEHLNSQGCEYAGVWPDATEGWDCLSLVHPDDADRVQRAWMDAVRTESLFELECRLRRADGAFRWHSVAGLPLRDGDGQIVKWFGTATDIDDQKHREDQLRRAERESAALEALQLAAPVGFGFVDRELRWVRVNEALASFSGAPVEEHLGRTVAEMMPAVWPQLSPVCRHVLETWQPVLNRHIVGEAAAATPGAQTWLTSCYPVRVEGKVIGLGIVVVDITDQRAQADQFHAVVMATMAEGLYTADSEGRFTFLNAAAERMLGWSEQELHGKPVHATIHLQQPDGGPLPDEERELLDARSEGQTVHAADDAYERKDGSIFPVAYSATPLLGGTEASGLVVVFRDTSEEKTERRRAKRELDALTWVGRTRDALDEGRLILYSQPIIPLGEGAPSEELLLRMVGREGEIIRPATFLPAAEKYGLIGEIDQRVVTQAAQLAASGRRVQANLSALSICRLDLLPVIERALGEAGANPSDLVFEITETALMEDVEAGEAFARGVTDIGCDLALDDFGTGYGSFTRLKKLPIKYLKIDIEFVRDLVSSTGDRHVIEAIVGLAKGFGQQTIAEGVEDAETLRLLGDSGVDFAQGYHLGRPVPLTEITAREGGREAA
jgi:PAS domain S-box-containing protein